jgi:hypothetical protein
MPITPALRVHFGFTEDLLLSQNDDFKALWLQRIMAATYQQR